MIGETATKLAQGGSGDKNMVPLARKFAARIRTFLTRWQDQPAVASEKAALATFRNMLLGAEAQIEALHISTLTELLACRKLSIHSLDLIGHSRRLADLLLRANPEARLEMLRQLKENPNMADFDPETAVAVQTASHAARQEEYEILLDEYEREWPDRLDDPHYLAILDLTLEQHDSIAEELDLMQSSFG